MLTSWKDTRTSIDYSLPPTKASAKKKTKSRKSLASESDAPSSSTQNVIGAQFIHPLACNDPFYKQRKNLSSSTRDNNKRRKVNNATAAGGALHSMDIEPILCLTSPHRVVFMGKKDGTNTNNGSAEDHAELTESKSRSYVTRPGTTSRFALGSSTPAGSTFAGMLPPGAQYDPSSNLVYAMRDGGKEVAVWTAVPSSVLPGPDDKASDGEDSKVTNGKKLSARERAENARKRKSKQHLDDANIFSQRLQLTEGKVAVTLTTFSIPASKGKCLAAFGAAGCCEDGSIWVAVRFHQSNDESHGSQFQLHIVEGSSMEEKEVSSSKNGKHPSKKKGRKSLAKANDPEKGKGGLWTLLDSHATGSTGIRNEGKLSVLLSVHSVVLSEDKSQVAFRNHQVRIPNPENSDNSRPPLVQVEKFSRQSVLQLEPSDSRDIAVKLDAGGDSLSIVHRSRENEDSQWMFTSGIISQSEGALINTMISFPLPLDDAKNVGSDVTVFSFGKVSDNIVALLTRSDNADHSKSCVLTLKMIDFRRKAELSSLCWTEGEGMSNKDGKSILDTALNGNKCHAMITNELDGSVALLTSSIESDDGSLHVVSSRLETNSPATQTNDAPIASSSTSLASALRFVATSGPHPLKTRKDTSAGPNSETEASAHQSALDETVDKACELLATSAKELIDHTTENHCAAKNGSMMNGKSRKGRKAHKKKSSISWSEVYHSSVMMIAGARDGGKKLDKTLVNGVRSQVNNALLPSGISNEMPKRFIEAAFKESATLLLSAESSAKGQNEHKAIQTDAAFVLVETLQTNLISARADYGLGLLCRGGNSLLSILEACPTPSLTDNGNGVLFGKLQVIDAMLDHVKDIPEGVLVSLLRFVLRNAREEDVVAYYATASQKEMSSTKGTRLSNQYRKLKDAPAGEKQRVGTKLLSVAMISLTSKIVTYSNCNHSFLTKAIRDSINTSGEVETLLVTLAKVLKLGSTPALSDDFNVDVSNVVSHSNQAGLTLGTIQWISALTDAHMSTILKISNEGGLVIDRIQRAVRAAMAQSELASEVREISDFIMMSSPESSSTDLVSKSSSKSQSRSSDTVIVSYSMERLTF